MTKEQFEARIDAYKNDIDALNKRILQANADINALNGAIQDCQYWLSQIEECPKANAIEPVLKKTRKSRK